MFAEILAREPSCSGCKNMLANGQTMLYNAYASLRLATLLSFRGNPTPRCCCDYLGSIRRIRPATSDLCPNQQSHVS